VDLPNRPRIAGVDVARGLAVLGMFTAHVHSQKSLTLPNGGTLFEVADGRPAAGFALLAGISAALLSGGRWPYSGPRLTHARVRVLARAILLWPLGAAMIALRTPVIVILPTYALLFAVMAGVLHLRQRTLLTIAAAILAVAPPLVLLARDQLYTWESRPSQLVDITIGHYYPAAIWIVYLLVGLAVGRIDLLAPRIQRRLVLWGTVSAAVGLGTNAVAMRVVDPSHTLQRALLTSAPHSSSPVELVANIGVVLAVLGLCLAAAERFPRIVAPVAATGALALTAYCGHLVAIAIIGPQVVWSSSDLPLAAFVGVTLLVTWGWRTALGRGPLERLLHEASTWVADRVVPAGRRDVHASTVEEVPHQVRPPREPVLAEEGPG
jgi:uncharacterized membrane protein